MAPRTQSLAMALVLLAVLCVVQAAAGYDDFHYPAEEPSERASLLFPQVSSISPSTGTAVLAPGSQVQVGSVFTINSAEWHVTAILDTLVAIEVNFERWAMIAFVGEATRPLTLRKAVGRLDKIVQPYFNFTAADPDYFTKIEAALDDYATTLASKQTPDGEPDYPSIAGQLAPQRDLASISNPADVIKFVVTFNGRIKCGTLGITETRNQTAPPLNQQLVVFDPAEHLSYWPEAFNNSKMGLVGGHLRIANVGAFDNARSQGYDLVAFAPIFHPSSATPAPSPACAYTAAQPNKYIAVCSDNCDPQTSLDAAKAACDAAVSCGGITLRGGQYQLRANHTLLPSPTGETSWLITNPAECHTLPRLPNINYTPGVFVRLREQLPGAFGGFKYFYATNASLTAVNGSEFCQHLVEYVTAWNGTFTEGMEVRFPDGDRRQVDMAKSALQSSFSNFVGHQPNYGNGMTYWSVAREDNGSLPLNILSVGDAMLDWGLCGTALPDIGFYLDNYVRPDGTIDYYTWGTGQADSISDHGRLLNLFVKALQLCPDEAWARQYIGAATALGEHLYALWAAANAAASKQPPGCHGLLQGAPEHDWGSTTNLHFYNNNAWTVRGLDMMGQFFSLNGPFQNATRSASYLAAATTLRTNVMASLTACTLTKAGQPEFLPPYAHVGATPYKSMTESREACYSNFRFYSETLLADLLPRDIEAMLLGLHNDLGGRVGGASRFETWLDDMPTAGWGYGALTNNRTSDFLALLYGHAATYQSRGTFHSTEQLQWKGEGWYRDFLHWPNPPSTTGGKGLGYYAQENDISFCIVSESLVARMTRWQLVFEDFYRGQDMARPWAGNVWLGRGAPRRWFAPGSGGFAVSRAATHVGRVSFTLEAHSNSSATYSITVAASGRSTVAPLATVADVVWHTGFPGHVTAPTVSAGCRVVAMEQGSVAVTCVAGTAQFSVSASYTP